MVDQGQEPLYDGPPVSFGKYLLDREIARGGMARVYSARLRGLGGFEKRLVVKQILPHLAEDPRFVEMFVHEAKTLVALSHPHVVPVYELGIEGGVYFLAMEHVEGATLADILGDGPLAHVEAAHLGVQVADALAYADERFGLVHRDVTPRNVMIDGSGHARLLDFGIAARTDDPSGTGLYGTPGYLSPEQARGESVSARSDLFSLGCVLFEAIRAKPFLPGIDLEPIRNLSRADVEARVGGSSELEGIIRMCLAPDPKDRPESARVLGRLLRSVVSGAEDPARTLGLRAEAARSPKKRAKRARTPPRPRGPGSERPPPPISERPPPLDPTSDAPPRGSTTLATSRLLGELLEGGTAKIPRASTPSGEITEPSPEPTGSTVRLDKAPGTGPQERTSKEPAASPWPIVLGVSLVLGAVAFYLARNAELDPPVGDASEVLTDTDGTMWIPADDAGPDGSVDAAAGDAGNVPTDADDGADAGTPDAGTGEGGRRATVRVRSDGSLTVRVNGRLIGHAPVSHAVSAGEHRLTFECDYLGRTAEERVRFAPGATVVIGVTCSATPPRVVVSGGTP